MADIAALLLYHAGHDNKHTLPEHHCNPVEGIPDTDEGGLPGLVKSEHVEAVRSYIVGSG